MLCRYLGKTKVIVKKTKLTDSTALGHRFAEDAADVTSDGYVVRDGRYEVRNKHRFKVAALFEDTIYINRLTAEAFKLGCNGDVKAVDFVFWFF